MKKQKKILCNKPQACLELIFKAYLKIGREEIKPKIIDTHFCLNLPEFSLFSTVHLTVDDQHIWQTSNVARLHLQQQKKDAVTMKNRVESK